MGEGPAGGLAQLPPVAISGGGEGDCPVEVGALNVNHHPLAVDVAVYRVTTSAFETAPLGIPRMFEDQAVRSTVEASSKILDWGNSVVYGML